MKQEKPNYEEFFDSINDQLGQFAELKPEDLKGSEKESAYPIRNELKNLKEHYKDTEFLSEGGLKAIYKAHDIKTGRAVALAVPKIDTNIENTESFLREARLTASLEHPNIISIYDINLDDNERPYFVMELLKGKNLDQVIQSGKQSRNKLLEMFNKVCEAVAYAHSKQVLHLDLKPENIHIGEYGEVHLCDWGLACIQSEHVDSPDLGELDPDIINHATLHGRIKGSPGYMAPEQAGLEAPKDVRTDIYALGAILYTICTGQSPIKNSHLDDLLHATKFAKIKPIPDVAEVPQRLQSIIYKCLSRKPEDRYQKIHELQSDLDNYQLGFATDAENAGFLTHLQLLVMRHKWAASSILCVTALISILIANSIRQINKERDQANAAKEIAEQNYDLLLKQQNFTRTLRNQIVKIAYSNSLNKDLSSPEREISLLKFGLKFEKHPQKRTTIAQKLGKLHLVNHDFANAEHYFKLSGDQRLLKTSQWALKQNDGNPIETDESALQVLKQLYSFNHDQIIKAFYLKYIEDHRDPANTAQSYLPIASVMLNVINGMWGAIDKSNSLNLENRKLTIKPGNYKSFRIPTSMYNIFAPIDFHTLDLSNTDFFEYFQLEPLKFNELILTNCKPNTINPQRIIMLKNIGVSKITVSQKQISQQEISLLKENLDTVTVID